MKCGLICGSILLMHLIAFEAPAIELKTVEVDLDARLFLAPIPFDTEFYITGRVKSISRIELIVYNLVEFQESDISDWPSLVLGLKSAGAMPPPTKEYEIWSILPSHVQTPINVYNSGTPVQEQLKTEILKALNRSIQVSRRPMELTFPLLINKKQDLLLANPPRYPCTRYGQPFDVERRRVST
jgi:hypothetical protein